MIRSWIGIVCVLVFVTTCVQTTAAQAHGNFPLTSMRHRVLPTQIWNWIELADQGVSDRLLSSDAYHNDFRFRAAPVKQSPNWQMPIVDVRPAKPISISLISRSEKGSAASRAIRSNENNSAPVVDWVWESSSDLAVRYSELNSPFDPASLAVIPRPLPTRTKRVQHRQTLAVTVAPVGKFALQLVAKSKFKPSKPKPELSVSNNSAPVVDWVWESPSDLAVRFSELSSAVDLAAMAVIPRPLPVQAKPAIQKQLLITKVGPTTKFSIQLFAKSKASPAAPKRQRASGYRTVAPVVDWVWESSSDLAVRYSELSGAFDRAAMAIIPRPLPTRTKAAKTKSAKTKSDARKLKLSVGKKDYWNYYAHCDRWNVVFAKPGNTSKSQSNSSNAEEIVSVDRPAKQYSGLVSGLKKIAALVADRWGDAVTFSETFSNRFQTSQN